MSEEGWLDANGEWIEPSELGPLDEVMARLRGYEGGELQAFLESPARREQGLQPEVLPAQDQRLARELLALPPDRPVVEQALRSVGPERARSILRQVVAQWSEPKRMQQEVWLYLQRRQGEVLWLLEEVGIGVTGVRVQISASGPLPNEIAHQVFFPTPDLKPFPLEPWWSEFETQPQPLRLSDDLGTGYKVESSQVERIFPLRVIAAGRGEARMAERYIFTFVPGVPAAARSLSLSGTINLVIEEPVTESPPWPTKEFSLGDFTYTIDLQGWWPDVIREDGELE